MSVSIKSMKCPECGASLSMDSEKPLKFCSFCGSNLLILNENEQIIRHVDEAKLKQAETEQMVRLKELELQEKEAEELRKRKAVRRKTGLILLIAGLLLTIIGMIVQDSNDKVGSTIGVIGIFILLADLIYWLASKPRSKSKK